MKYPSNTAIGEISPVYSYNKASLNFFAGTTFASVFNANTHKKTAAQIMSGVKSGFTTQFNDWKNNIYAQIDMNSGQEEVMKNMQALGVIFSLIMMPLVLFTRWLCEKLTPDISY